MYKCDSILIYQFYFILIFYLFLLRSKQLKSVSKNVKKIIITEYCDRTYRAWQAFIQHIFYYISDLLKILQASKKSLFLWLFSSRLDLLELPLVLRLLPSSLGLLSAFLVLFCQRLCSYVHFILHK